MPTITRTAASLIGIVAVFALVLYLAYGGSDDPATTPTPTSSAVVAASPTGTPRPQVTAPPTLPTPTPGPNLPSVLEGTDVLALRQGDPIELPEDVALIIQTGCWQCDGWPAGLMRVYRNAAGEVVLEEMFSPALLGLPPRITPVGSEPGQIALPHILTFASAADASRMVVAVCTAGDCGGLNYPSVDAETTLFSSTDGGVTWSPTVVMAGAHHVTALVPGDVVLLGPVQTSEGQPRPPYYLLSTGETIEPPAAASPLGWPKAEVGGSLVWQTDHGDLVASDGTQVFAAGNGYSSPTRWLTDPDNHTTYLSWSWFSGNEGSGSRYFLTQIDDAGDVDRSWYSATPLSFTNSSFGRWYGNAELPQDTESPQRTIDAPVVVDLREGTFRPIGEPFFDPAFVGGAKHVVAVQPGPFARVVNTGSCLNIREVASLAAPVLTCAADNVLLRAALLSDINGEQWLSVQTPSGIDGWASAEYLEF